MSTSISDISGKFFSLSGLKLIVFLIISFAIYQFVSSYIQIKLGIKDLPGTFINLGFVFGNEIKIENAVIGGAVLSIIEILIFKLLLKGDTTILNLLKKSLLVRFTK